MICIGVMTGNSLDAVDVVLTQFKGKSICDLTSHSKPIPAEMAQKFRALKQKLSANTGDIQSIFQEDETSFLELHNSYIELVAQTIKELLNKSDVPLHEIKAIGFHGQTCHHFPPSIAGENNEVSTLQIGSGQMLANLTQIPVVYDFRSDDIMNGGEGAPLAPIHNLHLAESLQDQNIFPVAFCNGGNTGNITIISSDLNSKQIHVSGWDTGPFNHFIDYLAQTEANLPCDIDGKIGLKGKLNYHLLDKLYHTSVITAEGKNFLDQKPPKSSDPAWYKIIPELVDKSIPLEDRIHTVECFSAQIMAKSLRFIPFNVERPKNFLLFGGGWNNPVTKNYFETILTGQNKEISYFSEEFKFLTIKDAKINFSDKFGYSGKYMEARIFADMARCFFTQEPFSLPTTTSCSSPTVGGILATPGEENTQFWSRAAKGWKSI